MFQLFISWFISSKCKFWCTRARRFAWDISRSSPVRIHDPSLNVSKVIRLSHISRRRTPGRGNEGSRPTPTDFLLTTCQGDGWSPRRRSPALATPARERARRRQPGCIRRHVIDTRATQQMWNRSLCDMYIRGAYTSCSLASFARESPFTRERVIASPQASS